MGIKKSIDEQQGVGNSRHPHIPDEVLAGWLAVRLVLRLVLRLAIRLAMRLAMRLALRLALRLDWHGLKFAPPRLVHHGFRVGGICFTPVNHLIAVHAQRSGGSQGAFAQYSENRPGIDANHRPRAIKKGKAMSIKNSDKQYAGLVIAMHWLMLVVLALVYACMELRGLATKGSDLYNNIKALHFSLGLCVIGLVVQSLSTIYLRGLFKCESRSCTRWQAA